MNSLNKFTLLFVLFQYLIPFDAIQAQPILFDGSFNQINFTGSNTCKHVNRYNAVMGGTAPFQACTGSQMGWLVPYGTPSIYKKDLAPPEGNNGDRWLLLWSGKDFGDDPEFGGTTLGESVYTICSTFKKDKTYSLTFQLDSRHEFDVLQLRLTHSKDLPKWRNPLNIAATHVYITVPDFQVIFDKSNHKSPGPKNQAMEFQSITFTPEKDYDALWIYIYHSGSDPNHIAYFDDFEFPKCEIIETFNSAADVTNYHVQAQDHVFFNNTTMNLGTDLLVNAGKTININPESSFEITPGSNSWAFFQIKDCPNNDLECLPQDISDVFGKITPSDDGEQTNFNVVNHYESLGSNESANNMVLIDELIIYTITGSLEVDKRNISEESKNTILKSLPPGMHIINTRIGSSFTQEKISIQKF